MLWTTESARQPVSSLWEMRDVFVSENRRARYRRRSFDFMNDRSPPARTEHRAPSESRGFLIDCSLGKRALRRAVFFGSSSVCGRSYTCTLRSAYRTVGLFVSFSNLRATYREKDVQQIDVDQDGDRHDAVGPRALHQIQFNQHPGET